MKKKWMQFVDPIRDKRKISQIENNLRAGWKIRDLLLFKLWINSALRISDLLAIRVLDIYEDNGDIKESVVVKESKTQKSNTITVTPGVKSILSEYKETYPTIVSNKENFLFFRQKTFPLWLENINRVSWWRLIRSWCKDVWLSGNYGGHTLRKTWGYQARMAAVDQSLIQHKLNHSSWAITKKYLGITDEELKKVCMEMDL